MLVMLRTNWYLFVTYIKVVPVVDIGLGSRSKAGKGHLMTSSYSTNRYKTFPSSLGRGYAGHAGIRSWDYVMTDITENTKGY